MATRRIRVLVCTERFWPETFIINQLVEYLESDNLEVTVLTQQPSYPLGRLPEGWSNKWRVRNSYHGTTVVRYRTVLGYRNSFLKKVLNYISFAILGAVVAGSMSGRPPDVILIYQTGPLTMAIPGIVASIVHRAPVLIWTQDIWPDVLYAFGVPQIPPVSTLLVAFVRWAYRRCDRIAVSSPGFLEPLHRFAKKRIRVIPNWPVQEPASTETPVNLQRRFLFAGNIGRFQELDNVVLGYGEARVQEPTVGEMVVAGDGSKRKEVEHLAARRGIPVTWLGRVSQSAVEEQITRSDVLVMSLTNEAGIGDTIPSKFQTYLASGRPILAAARASIRNLVDQHSLGVTADPTNPKDIARAFVQLARTSDDELRRMGLNSRREYETTYAAHPIMASIKDVLLSLAST